MSIIDKKWKKIYNILVNNTSIIKHGGSTYDNSRERNIRKYFR